MMPKQEHDDTNADAPDERRAPTDGRLRPDARRWVESIAIGAYCYPETRYTLDPRVLHGLRRARAPQVVPDRLAHPTAHAG